MVNSAMSMIVFWKITDNNKDISIEGSLDVKIIDDIVNCLFLSEEDNISGIHKGLLRPPLQDSLQKLKDKFNKNR